MDKKDYIGPVISTYQFFNLTDKQKKEFKEGERRICRISRNLEKELTPIVARYGMEIRLENRSTKNSLTMESSPLPWYNGPALRFESESEYLEHLTCQIDLEEK